MTPTEATSLADTLTRAWPKTGVAHEIWMAALNPLEFTPALNAIAALVDTFDQPPSVVAFKAAYRGQTPAARPLREDCSRCDGTGWEEIEVHRNGHPGPTTGVVPCKCSNGKANDDAHRRAIEHNDLELRRATRPNGIGTAA
jgi:hypothetical protein